MLVEAPVLAVRGRDCESRPVRAREDRGQGDALRVERPGRQPGGSLLWRGSLRALVPPLGQPGVPVRLHANAPFVLEVSAGESVGSHRGVCATPGGETCQPLLGCGDLREHNSGEVPSGVAPVQSVAVAEAGHLEREQPGVEEGPVSAQAALWAVGHLIAEGRDPQAGCEMTQVLM